MSRTSLILCTAALLSSCSAFQKDKNQQNPKNSNNQPQESQENVDVWLGPGFYYGIWFDNEDDYWGWRGNHRDYPPNRDYYHPSQPIPYHEEERGSREAAPYREGGGGGRGPMRGGGGHSSGGGHR